MFTSTMAGYDRAITVFSPDGKLFQVEYAVSAVKRAPPTIGIKTKEGVALIAKKRMLSKLMEAESVEKVFRIDEHIGAAMAGLYGDARVLVNRAREESQSNRLSFKEPITTLLLTRRLSNLIQLFTQNAGVRPFGVILLIGGIDDSGPSLYMTHPSGAYYGYKAVAVGAESDRINEVLEKKYREDLSLDEAIKLGLNCLKEVDKEELTSENVEIGLIRIKDKKFKKLGREEIGKYLKMVS